MQDALLIIIQWWLVIEYLVQRNMKELQCEDSKMWDPCVNPLWAYSIFDFYRVQLFFLFLSVPFRMYTGYLNCDSHYSILHPCESLLIILPVYCILYTGFWHFGFRRFCSKKLYVAGTQQIRLQHFNQTSVDFPRALPSGNDWHSYGKSQSLCLMDKSTINDDFP